MDGDCCQCGSGCQSESEVEAECEEVSRVDLCRCLNEGVDVSWCGLVKREE